MAHLLLLSIGIFSVAWWPSLPDIGLALACWVSLLPVWLIPRARPLLFLGAGMLWGLLAGAQLHQTLLPEAFNGEEFKLSGRIVGLVEQNDVRSRFSFAVEEGELLTRPGQQVVTGKILLSWYGADNLQPGQQWQLIARLRRPRGFVNPRAFDYQSWLLQQGYIATGYVRSPQHAQPRIEDKYSPFGSIAVLPAILRSNIRRAIEAANLSPRGHAVLLALTIGDKSRLAVWWQELARFGIVHLLVISGLHIGLIALFGVGLGKLLVRGIIVCTALLKHSGVYSSGSTLHWLPPIFGLLAAIAYSLLAGFSLPTQRALIAVAVVVFARLRYRHIQPFVCLVWALVAIALCHPLAVLSASFWLSFAAVAVLIAWFSPWQSSDRWWPQKRALTAQVGLLLVMSVPLLLFVGRISWLAPLVNLAAIPWVSFLTVPSALIGCLLWPVSESAATFVWRISDWTVTALWWLLDKLPVDQGVIVSPIGTPILALSAVLLASVALMLPSMLHARWLGLLPLVLLLSGGRPASGLRVTVLDVGQGLAVVVETSNHSLLYDSGARYSPAFSAGSGIIAPYFWQRGYTAIDRTIISHEDGDHSGGFAALQQVLPSRSLVTGPAVAFSPPVLAGLSTEVCRAGQRWSWDDVSFQILAPDLAEKNGKEQHEIEQKWVASSGNNSSCVLQISWGDITVLLPGDIESDAEYRLLQSDLLSQSPLDLLIAPHHGSKTSSTDAFVRRLRPKQVIFSAGYQHQFGHPHKSVTQRYVDLGSTVWNTAEQGAITFEWQSAGDLTVRSARRDVSRWWR